MTATDRHGKNALHHAAFRNRREKCQLLILFGADPTEEDWKGRSAVSHYGCDLYHNDEDDDDPPLTPEEELERVAELTTPPTLFWACREGFKTLVGLLVDLGASLTDVNEEGLNALHIAAYWGNEDDVWKALIARGADPAVEDSQGRSALTAYCCNLGEAYFNEIWGEGGWDEADVAHWKQDGVNKMLEAREEYVMLVRQQKWTKNWPFLHALVGSRLRPTAAQIAEQAQAQVLLDKSVPLPPEPRETKAENIAYLNHAVLGHDGLVRRIASFMPSKEDEEREARRQRLELQTQSQSQSQSQSRGGSLQEQVLQLRKENQQLRKVNKQLTEENKQLVQLREEISILRLPKTSSS